MGNVTTQSINYVSKYCMKKKYGKDAEDYDKQGIKPEFSVQSMGIGKNWCDKNKDWIRYHHFVYLGNKKVPTPRYYLKRCFNSEELYDELIKRQQEKWDEHYENYKNNPNYSKFLFESLNQSWYNFHARQRVTGRK